LGTVLECSSSSLATTLGHKSAALLCSSRFSWYTAAQGTRTGHESCVRPVATRWEKTEGRDAMDNGHNSRRSGRCQRPPCARPHTAGQHLRSSHGFFFLVVMSRGATEREAEREAASDEDEKVGDEQHAMGGGGLA
jgi:hypothetical protein